MVTKETRAKLVRKILDVFEMYINCNDIEFWDNTVLLGVLSSVGIDLLSYFLSKICPDIINSDNVQVLSYSFLKDLCRVISWKNYSANHVITWDDFIEQCYWFLRNEPYKDKKACNYKITTSRHKKNECISRIEKDLKNRKTDYQLFRSEVERWELHEGVVPKRGRVFSVEESDISLSGRLAHFCKRYFNGNIIFAGCSRRLQPTENNRELLFVLASLTLLNEGKYENDKIRKLSRQLKRHRLGQGKIEEVIRYIIECIRECESAEEDEADIAFIEEIFLYHTDIIVEELYCILTKPLSEKIEVNNKARRMCVGQYYGALFNAKELPQTQTKYGGNHLIRSSEDRAEWNDCDMVDFKLSQCRISSLNRDSLVIALGRFFASCSANDESRMFDVDKVLFPFGKTIEGEELSDRNDLRNNLNEMLIFAFLMVNPSKEYYLGPAIWEVIQDKLLEIVTKEGTEEVCITQDRGACHYTKFMDMLKNICAVFSDSKHIWSDIVETVWDMADTLDEFLHEINDKYGERLKALGCKEGITIQEIVATANTIAQIDINELLAP